MPETTPARPFCGPRAPSLLLVAAMLILAGSLPTVAAAATPPTVVSLTFDDGTASQYSARSLLTRFGMHATFFINSGRLNTSGYLSSAQVQQLAADGNEIGGHTVSHADLPALDIDEQRRQVCNDRVALTSLGVTVTDFAYPYGDVNATAESVVEACGYNSARVVGGVVSPGSCNDCDYAETLPPVDPFATATPDSIKTSTTLTTLKDYVLQAESHGGGWVQIVMHHVCGGSGCDELSVDPTVLSSFLAWLAGRPSTTTVKTVREVIGGPVTPPVSGPPVPATTGGGELLRNPSLETATLGIPDCWTLGGFGGNSATWSWSPLSAHSGASGEQLQMTSYTDGDRKLVSKQDLGACAPTVYPGHSYVVSLWYRSSVPIRPVAYTRSSAGGWVWWNQSPSTFPAGSGWAQASWTTPALPADTTALSVGPSLRSVGTATFDDLSLRDADQTPPTVSLTSPTDGQRVKGTVTLSASAADAGGVERVEFLVNGAVVATDSTAPYSVAWDSTTVRDDTVAITARAVDRAGNAALAPSALVTLLSSDTTPPVTSAACDGSPCGGDWYAAGTTLTLSATDLQSGVAAIHYTTDGSDPDLASPVYQGALTLQATTTVRYRAYDVAGNAETTHSVSVRVDAAPPSTSISCDGGLCAGWHLAPTSVALTATDASGSGVASIRYTLDGSTPTAASATYTAPISLPSSTTLTYRAYDVAGNAEAPQARRVDVDAVDPTVTVTAPEPGAIVRASTTISAAAGDDSGVDHVTFLVDDAVVATDDTAPYEARWESTDVPDGPHTISARTVDLVGHTTVSASVQVSVANQQPASDTSPPSSSASCDGAPCDGPWRDTPVAVSLSATDDASGVEGIYYTLDGSTPNRAGTRYAGPFMVGAPTTVRFRAYDVAGNAESPQSVDVHVDTATPSASIACAGSCDDWLAAPAGVTLEASDADSSVASIHYTLDGTDPNALSPTYSHPLALNATTTVSVRAYDEAGNPSPVTRQTVRVDAGAPSTDASCAGDTCPTGWTAATQTVTLAAADDASGVAAIRYTTDGTAPTGSSALYSAPVGITHDTTLRYRAYDRAGNAEPVRELRLKVDQTAPSTTATCGDGACSGAWSAAPLPVVLAATDADSGVDGIHYTTDGTTPTASSPLYAGPLSLTQSTTLRYRAIDAVGNLEAVATQALHVDAAAPSSAITCDGTACSSSPYDGSASVALTATDADSGVAAIRYTTDGTTPSSSSTAYGSEFKLGPGTTTVSFRAYDRAGNAEAVHTQVVKVDAPNLLKNASLETATAGVPDCWTLGGFGTNTFLWTRTADAHAGSFGETVQITALTDGNRKLVSKQDAGACAPVAVVGHTYRTTAWYKGSGKLRLVAYYRSSAGSWVWWAQSALLTPSAAWLQATWTTPAFPSGATHVSVGPSLESAGNLAADDLTLRDSG